jgi:hypothetical protein
MTRLFVSPATLLTTLVGLVIATFYVRHMWAALRKAVRTRHESEEGQVDRYHHSLIGAVISVVLAAAFIGIYGIGPAALYLGPALALLSPIAVAYCLRQEWVEQ